MEFRILGPIEVVTGGAPVPLRRGLPLRLLAALLVRANETVSVDVLIEQLWGDDAPVNAQNSVQVQVSYVRKTVPISADEHARPALVTRGPGYALLVDDDHVDARRFEVMVAEARALGRGDDRQATARAVDLSAAAAALWRGEALSDVAYEPFAQPEISRLDELRLLAAETHAEALLALDRPQEAVAELSYAVAEAPLRERFHELLMVALYRCGRQADALRVYDSARDLLREELGLDPSPELREAQRRILEQDTALGASTADPGARAPAPVPACRLAVPATGLVGRVDEVERAEALLAGHRVVTVTGPGGAGKTRLALEVARRAEARGVDVCWVGLDAVADGDNVAATVAAALGAATRPGHDVLDDAVAGARDVGLLVLDNCEHVVDAVAPLASRLVAAGESPGILATSRRPLEVAGELAWPLPPLSLPDPATGATLDASEIAEADAVRLFCARAAEWQGEFVLDRSNAPAVAQLCTMLDGLPLAIELAASRMSVFSPAALAARIEDRMELLVSTQRDLPDRHRSLRAVLDASYELLSPAEQAFFDRLSVFVGGFALDAAAAVAGAGLDVAPVELLASLAQQSLVTREVDDRFRLLETVHSYARSHLDDTAGERDAATERHARWYAQWIGRADAGTRGPDQDLWMARLRAETGNVRAALEWSARAGEPQMIAWLASGASWFWLLQGMFAEADEWLRLAADEYRAPDGIRAAVLTVACMHASSLGDFDRAVDIGTEALALLDDHRHPQLRAVVLGRLGIGAWATGDYDEAARLLDDAIAIYRETGDTWGSSVSLFLRGRVAMDRGDADAGPILREALRTARSVGDGYGIAVGIEGLARLALLEGRAARAELLSAEALTMNEAGGYREGVVSASNALGLVRHVRGDDASARRLHRRALGEALAMQFPAGVIESVEGLALATPDAIPAATMLAYADHNREKTDLVRPRLLRGLVDARRAAIATDTDAGELADARAEGECWTNAELRAELIAVTG